MYVLVSRLATRSPSLDLVWPESPHQPSTTAGQPGQLSPVSCRLVDLRGSRQDAVKEAWQLYTDRSTRAVGIAENPMITVDRQAKR